MKNKQWNDYLWIWTILYFILGFFNILFAWLGMIDFIVPLLIAIFSNNKSFCNSYCGRGQLLNVLGTKVKPHKDRPTPKWLYSKWFRYGFLAFFLIMFTQMVYVTYLVFKGETLREVVTLLWTFKMPWQWANIVTGVPTWVVQYSFGFYSVMLTSAIIGIVCMLIFRPRTWCAFCPMGTMTQGICKLKNK